MAYDVKARLCDDGTLLLLFRGGGLRAAQWIRTYGTQANRLTRLELPRQGSNLDSSDPESDVLPVTPRGIVGVRYQVSGVSHPTPVT